MNMLTFGQSFLFLTCYHRRLYSYGVMYFVIEIDGATFPECYNLQLLLFLVVHKQEKSIVVKSLATVFTDQKQYSCIRRYM